jgi:four helix bundle protein
MQDVRKLSVYREARELAILVYGVTSSFPPAERFGLTQQMRRAAVSVGSNIAEGCGRMGSRALVPFLHYAVGSAKELEFQVDLAIALGFCAPESAENLLEQVTRTQRMLIRLAVAVRRRAMAAAMSSPPTAHRPPHHPR